MGRVDNGADVRRTGDPADAADVFPPPPPGEEIDFGESDEESLPPKQDDAPSPERFVDPAATAQTFITAEHDEEPPDLGADGPPRTTAPLPEVNVLDFTQPSHPPPAQWSPERRAKGAPITVADFSTLPPVVWNSLAAAVVSATGTGRGGGAPPGYSWVSSKHRAGPAGPRRRVRPALGHHVEALPPRFHEAPVSRSGFVGDSLRRSPRSPGRAPAPASFGGGHWTSQRPATTGDSIRMPRDERRIRRDEYQSRPPATASAPASADYGSVRSNLSASRTDSLSYPSFSSAGRWWTSERDVVQSTHELAKPSSRGLIPRIRTPGTGSEVIGAGMRTRPRPGPELWGFAV